MFALNAVAFLTLCLASLSAAERYDGGCRRSSESRVLRIGNGGAGQTGLVKELADEFIRYETKDCTENPVEIEWIKGDTTETINNLKTGDVDIGITYNTAAELNAIKSGFAHGCDQCPACESCLENNQGADKEFCGMAGDCSCCESCHDYLCYSFRDHFYLIGPNENLDGEQRLEENDSIVTMFSKIYAAAEAKNSAVRFLSRYDKSATNIKDSELWIKAGQVPWAPAYSRWYHQYIAYPLQALEAAIRLKEFPITDRGTHLTLQNQNKALTYLTTIYKSGEDDPDLLNPGHLLISTKSREKKLARDFVEWTNSERGQTVIANFHKGNGLCLYKPYPSVNEVRPSKCVWKLDGQKERMEL